MKEGTDFANHADFGGNHCKISRKAQIAAACWGLSAGWLSRDQSIEGRGLFAATHTAFAAAMRD
jgi:hypothetical protein